MTTTSKTTNNNQQTLADPTMSPSPATLPAQSATSTIPQTNERIQSAQSQINDLNARKEKAEADFTRKQAFIAQMQQGLQSVAEERSRLDSELERDAHEKELAEWQREPEPVGFKDALAVAESLVSALEQYDSAPAAISEAERNPELWEVIDNARQRIQTTDVNPESSMIIIAVEGVIGVAADWEQLMLDRKNDAHIDSGSLRFVIGDNLRFQNAVTELKQILIDDSEPPTMEEPGRLIADGQDFPFVAKTLGMMRPDNRPDTFRLGRLIEGRCAIKPSWQCVRRWATTDLEEAWSRRQADISRRRSLPTSAAESHPCGTERPARGAGYASVINRQRHNAAQDEAAEFALDVAQIQQ